MLAFVFVLWPAQGQEATVLLDFSRGLERRSSHSPRLPALAPAAVVLWGHSLH